MDKATIVLLREEADRHIQEATLRLEQAKGMLTAVQTVCEHPDARDYYAMGERGTICPDCAYQT